MIEIIYLTLAVVLTVVAVWSAASIVGAVNRVSSAAVDALDRSGGGLEVNESSRPQVLPSPLPETTEPKSESDNSTRRADINFRDLSQVTVDDLLAMSRTHGAVDPVMPSMVSPVDRQREINKELHRRGIIKGVRANANSN